MVLNEHIFERLFVQYIFKNNEAQLRIFAEIAQLLLKLNYGMKVRIIDSIQQNTSMHHRQGKSRNSRRFPKLNPKCRGLGTQPLVTDNVLVFKNIIYVLLAL